MPYLPLRIITPPRYTSFIGRRSLLTEVRQRLAEYPLVTLTGWGGIGKTRIAAQVAEEGARTFSEGLWWAELDAVPDADLVVPTVATAMDLRAESAVPLTELIADHVADRRALLVLDGCERELPEVVRLLVALRAECRNLRVLVTSRQTLGMAGEVVVRVPPLSVPEPGAPLTARTAGQYESVLLFLDRASLVGADFRLTDENAPAVGELCRALEGIPLAIELAAGQLAALAPGDMLVQLADHLALLDQGYADAPPRHRSLAASADWSYDLCSTAERALWCRMSVFADGYDLHAVQAVCVDDDLASSDVPGLVASLVDKCVVAAAHSDDGAVRYTMPAYLAAYGWRRLVEDGTLGHWRGRHAHWIAELAAGFRSLWVGSRQGALLRQARREHANIRAALEFCSSEDSLGELVLTIATDLDAFWVTTGLANEARHWLEIGLAGHHGKPALRAMAMVMAARFAGLQNDLSEALDWLGQADAEAEAADDDQARGLTQVLRAILATWDGDVDRAVAAARSSVELLRDGDDAEFLALFVEGLCLGMAGDREAAERVHEDVIARTTELGETFRRSLALAGLAELALADGNLPRATVDASEALRMKTELDDRMGIGVVLDLLARIALEDADLERSAILLGAAHAIWNDIGMRETGNPFCQASSPWRGVHDARRRMGKAEFRRSFRLGAEISRDRVIRYALTGELGPETLEDAAEPSPLTKRETEVAALVAEGLSNREIAERLVVSVRTAQGHVENILRKLGFTSRTMIAAWATRQTATDGSYAGHGPAAG